jgi:toxin ParE1/3/4
MTFDLRFAPRVWPEIAEAIAWHEEQRTGRGAELAAVLEQAFEEIGTWPERWPLWKPSLPYRRRVLLDFPYLVFYTVELDVVEVLAVAHAKRRPGYWIG